MSRSHWTKGQITIAVLAALCAAALTAPASGAMTLSSLVNPTVQTLIDLGSDGVTAGDARYFDFSYVAGTNAPMAAGVNVQSIGGDGLRFVASWLANNGSVVSSTISYDVASLDGSAITQVSLLANGSAPIVAAQTFATSTMSTGTETGAPVAPLLTTFDDGRTFPTDTTATDVDAASAALAIAQSPLSVTDTLTVVAGGGGLATASYVQNGFTFAGAVTTDAVPEPTVGAALLLVGLGWTCRRNAKQRKPVRSTDD